MSEETGWFCYTRVNGKIFFQRWTLKRPDNNVLQEHPLTAQEMTVSLDELACKYPLNPRLLTLDSDSIV